MGKEIQESLLPYFFKSGVTILTGYVFSIDAVDDQKYVANNEDIGSYAALSIKRNPIRSEEGTVINELEIGIDNVDLAFKNDVISGKYNNKECKIYLLFVEPGPSLVGSQLIFQGWIDEPKGDEHWITVTIRPFPLLERYFPKRIYQSGCNWTFCGYSCALDITDFEDSLSLSAESTDGRILTCSHGQAANYYVPGYVELTSGPYAGQYRPIESNSTTQIVVRIPFDGLLSNGTQLTAVKLCAKNYEVCQNDFANYSAYGGFPWVPKEPII